MTASRRAPPAVAVPHPDDAELRFRALADSAPVLIWMAGSDGRCTFFNKPWLDFTGRTLEQELGGGWVEGVHPEDRESCLRDYIEAFAARRAFRLEYRLRHIDGSYRWVLDTGVARTSACGAFEGYIGSAIDIHDMKSNELLLERQREELRASEHRYRSLLEQSTEGIFVLDPRTRRILEANARLLEMVGLPQEELVGRRLESAVGAAPEDVSRLIAAVLEKGRHVVGERHFVTRDGQGRDVEVSAGRVWSGAENLILVNVREITDRRAAEAALSEAERRNELILESAAEGILGLDSGGHHTFVNRTASQLIGYEPGEMLGRHSHEMWHHTRPDGTSYPDSDCPIYAALKDGRVHRVDNEVFWRRNGTSFPVEYVSSPLLLGDEIVGAVVVFRDVSKEARLESIAAAVETSNSIGHVFSAVRHELGNPVNSVKMALSVLRKNLGRFPLDTVTNYIDRSLTELGRVEDLLVSLKSFSLYEDIKVRDMDLADFIEKLAALARPDFEARGVKLLCSLPPQPIRALADPRALHQILFNLLANASDALAGRPEPTISVRCDSRNGFAEIRLEDNGCGMSEEVRRNLFKPFYTTKPSGTGLGLVITKKMLARMGAAIEVESRSGLGTTVVLAFGQET